MSKPHRPTRRQALQFLVASTLSGITVSQVWAEEDTVELIAAQEPWSAIAKVVYEVEGTLLSGTPNSQTAPKEHSLKAVGNYLYEEKCLDLSRRQALRYYREARADVSAQGRPSVVELRGDRRYVAIEPEPQSVIYRALQGPLTRAELELIEVPGGSIWVDQLLPGKAVKVGEKWQHEDALVARLFNLEVATANQTESELVSIADGKAQLNIRGRITGSVAGTVTALQVEGKYTFDLSHRRVTWLALGIQEDRSVGLASPGLKARARLRLLLQPDATPQLESPELETILTGAPANSGDLLQYQPADGGLTFLHDRNWHLFSEKSDLIVLRRILDGRVIGQCNLKRLQPLSVGQTVKMDQFQHEIRTALGSAVQQVVDAKESQTSQQLRQLRVALVGQVSGTPVHWIYYQLSDSQGRRVTCVFTMSGEEVERFGAEDLQLVDTLTFSDGEPAAAEPLARQPVDVR